MVLKIGDDTSPERKAIKFYNKGFDPQLAEAVVQIHTMMGGAEGAGIAARPIEKEAPSAKVLGFLAAHGPTRSVDVIEELVDEDNPKSPLTLTAVASAIDKLINQGMLERRQGELIAVLGDPR